MLVRVTIKFCSIALAGVAFAANAWAECTREMLQDLADTYVEAQSTGNAAMLPLAAGSYYGENDQAMRIAEGVLTEALTVDFTRSFYDTTQCATFTELPVPHGTPCARLEGGKNRYIHEATVCTTPGCSRGR